MIKISSEGTTTTIAITISTGHEPKFVINRSCQMDAMLLEQKIKNDLEEKIKSIRREAYLMGWDCAKKRKRKFEYFNGNINTSYVGY